MEGVSAEEIGNELDAVAAFILRSAHLKKPRPCHLYTGNCSNRQSVPGAISCSEIADAIVVRITTRRRSTWNPSIGRE
jgi:hypothetical protein